MDRVQVCVLNRLSLSNSRSEKHLLKFTDNVDSVLDTVADHRFDWHSVTHQPSFFELYRTGRLYFHIHFSWLSDRTGKIETHNLCAVYRRFPIAGGDLAFEMLASGDSDAKSGCLKLGSCDEQQAMLIDNVQLMER